MAQTKRCTKCGNEKLLSSFRKRSEGTYRGSCRDCEKIYNDAWRSENNEHTKAYNVDYRKRQIQEDETAYRQKRQEENKDSWSRFGCKHYQTHKETRLAGMHNLRAAKSGAAGILTGDDIKVIYVIQEGLCYWCKKELDGKYEIDHYIPLARGGSNYPSNIVVCHRACNRSKRDKMPWEFAKGDYGEQPR